VAKNWSEAGDTFVKVAECHIKLSSQMEAASAYNDAASNYQKKDPEKAITCYTEASALFIELGRFGMAAKTEKHIGELQESEANLEEAITHFQFAADYYNGENSTSSANQCELKVAHFCAQLGEFGRAVDIFESVGTTSLESNLLKYSVKEYFLKAGLCELCKGEPQQANDKFNKYCSMDVSFEESREGKFLQNLIEKVLGQDIEGFTTEVAEYDSITKLDPWKTTVLLTVKNQMKDAEEDLT